MNILLTFAADKTEMIQYFKQAVGNTGKVFASNCMVNYSLTQADGYLISPHAYEKSYIPDITDYCKKNNITVIVPLSGADLSVLSKNKNKLYDLDISVIVSDESVIDICIDRWKTIAFLKSIGVNHPKTYIDLKAAKRDIEAGLLSFPLFLKPRFSFEKTNGIDVDTIEELDLFYRKMQKSIIYSSDFQQNENQHIIIHEEIHGDRYGVSMLHNLKGNYVVGFTLRKLTATGDNIQLAHIENIMSLDFINKLISSGLKPISCFEIECYLKESGEITVSEINPYFGKQYPLIHAAGANFPKQIIDWLNGFPVLPDNISCEIGVMLESESNFKYCIIN